MIALRKDFLLNAWASYIRQTTVATKDAVMEAFSHAPEITEELLGYFDAKFNPAFKGDRALDEREEKISAALPKDIALKAVFSVLKATVRTNYYQGEKDYVSFKILSPLVYGLPKPTPMAEIFVYSDDVDAVHLRFGKIARGGIRWSDRKDDFRTEILGLVKTQQVKNVVIVPVGSKGGFYPKRPPENATKKELVENAVKCYQTMIRGLLDITDNIVAGKVVAPKKTVRYDNDDPYLVVAADKGTADFSDIANAISAEYGFWLGDAFASGGSAGFSHKGLAITARGSWESVKRHFNETGRDCQTQEFTAVGVGSMAGDVFGNAMLMSSKMKLVAAFNSTHIFIDPHPDCETSFAERKRLFDAEKGWVDYDRSKISAGGGVYSRKETTLTLSPEAREVLSLWTLTMTPDDLIKGILCAPVDLMYFGGIGTYVKASGETQLDAKDASNAGHRVNGCDIKAKVVGEGANLAMTPNARIEYAKNGGRLNNDAVDNSAGVDCSDHEVNIKIMLNAAMADGKLTLAERNALLNSLSEDVAALVLRDNFLQNQILSYMRFRGAKSIPGNKKLIHIMEKEGKLNRALEFLPSDADMDDRFTRGEGLTRPELCVLMAYAKLTLSEHLLNSDLPDDPAMESRLFGYFPQKLQKEWPEYIKKHQLRREIIGTVITNNLINRVGVNFITKMRNESGAPVIDILKAFLVVEDAFKTEEIFDKIEKTPMSSDERCTALRRVVAEIENMTLTVLREGMEKDIAGEAKRWAAYKDEKFSALRA